MNREIKFRAFNKVTSTMVDLHKITPLALQPGMKQEGVFLPFHDDWPLMQYTGLKDKNGVEIYEGDVIETEIGPYRKEILFSDFRAAFVGRPLPMSQYDEWNPADLQYSGQTITAHWMESARAKVIGNVYENPDLVSPAPDSNSDRGEGDEIVNEQTASLA